MNNDKQRIFGSRAIWRWGIGILSIILLVCTGVTLWPKPFFDAQSVQVIVAEKIAAGDTANIDIYVTNRRTGKPVEMATVLVDSNGRTEKDNSRQSSPEATESTENRLLTAIVGRVHVMSKTL